MDAPKLFSLEMTTSNESSENVDTKCANCSVLLFYWLAEKLPPLFDAWGNLPSQKDGQCR